MCKTSYSAAASAGALIGVIALGFAWSGSMVTANAQSSTTIEEITVEGSGAGAIGAETNRGLGSRLYGQGGAYGEATGYVAIRSAVATKTDTPILETAQSISVVPRQQIEDQAPLSIASALRYTPSVATETSGTLLRQENFVIRGFTAPQFLDGLALPVNREAFPTVDPYRLERIDIIKGPTSVLYGQAGAGGIVNFVSKVPRFVRHGEIFVQGGSFDTVRGGVDVGGPIPSEVPGLADQFAYRIVAGGWNMEGPVQYTRVERAFVNPSLTWRPSEDTQLTVIANYQRDPFGGNFSFLPARGTLFPRNFGSGFVGRLPTDFYSGARNFERSDRTQGSIEYLFDHRFNENLRFHSAGRYLRSEGDGREVGSYSGDPLNRNGFNASGPLIYRNTNPLDVEIDALTVDSNLIATFDTGIFGHTALVGVDYRSFDTRSLSALPAVPPLNILAPNYFPVIPFTSYTSDARITAEQTGVYFQDQVKFDRLVLTLGGRYDWARQFGPTINLNNGAITNQDVPAEAFTGRASLLYLFDSGVAPYVSYSEAFEPIVAGRIFDPALGSAGRLPVPISSNQYEAGIKYQPPGTDILLTAAFFDIRRANSTNPDPANTGFVVQTGEVGVQGVEFEARANISENLFLIGGVSFLDIRNTVSTGTTLNEVTGRQVPLLGRHPVQVPDTTASVFANYRFTDGALAGLGLGGGVRYLGSSWGDAANTFKVPESVILDAVATYDFKYLDPLFEGFNAQVNIQNLLDERYVASCFTYSVCYYAFPRTVLATLRYRW